ncbi:metallo-beta-lactamase superfamily protein [Collimonas arenae]|uniref:Metallo-beta-lactamase superfamily protein n=1 Tax=Collimonas arenae TaxID=279058 RepID=A0A127PTI8_9BURK|nr:MBL fold metallo-hydrolase [Collimonas arenae]AMP01140.1 metallo-beta-lactamase superfamily protein [Collimonas arenae]AMP11034.1 metallo-beta-lactamase superfamily protein [Collimonas arenae]
MASPSIEALFDQNTATFTYVVYEAVGGACAVIDPVLDYDPASGRTSTANADRVITFVRTNDLKVQWLLETHAHADHISAAPYLRQHLGGAIAIGDRIREVQGVFKKIFNLRSEFLLDGSQFDHLFAPDEIFQIGNLRAQAMHVPGHTPADMAYLVEDKVAFVGDTLFMPDLGTARCDFPGGSASGLYRSVTRLLSLPTATRLFVCHDYPPDGREPACESTVGEQRASNIHVRDGISESEFIAMRNRRDASLALPALMLPSIQLNVCAGVFPAEEENGVSYLKIPLNLTL